MNTVVLKGLVGSHAYGYATEASDQDWMSVYVADLDNYFGLKNSKSTQTLSENEDNVSYEFTKFVSLCSNFNPNVVPLLFLKSYPVETSKLGVSLLSVRKAFLTQKAYNSLMGYAVSQENKATKNLTGTLGTKRKELVDRYGYDVKSAAHTVRLMELAKHLFKYNEVRLDLSAEVCAEYRMGKYSVDDFTNHFQSLKEEVNLAFSNTTLPESVDMEYVNRFCVNALSEWFFGINMKLRLKE
jgi:predicted nucleotidyltransferase